MDQLAVESQDRPGRGQQLDGLRRAVSACRPRHVGFLTSRMLLSGGLAGIEAMESNAARAVKELASVPVDAIAYCCTVSGALRGIKGDRDFCRDMAQRWNIPVTSTMLGGD